MKSHLVSIFIICTFKILEINAGCYWNVGNPGTECLMYCIGETPELLKIAIENTWNNLQKPECQTDGIWLDLRTLFYPNGVIDSHWFTAEIKVYKLDVSLFDVKDISADAFDSDAFRTVKTLTLSYLGVDLVRNETFNGMDELEIINIKSAGNVRGFENGVLNSIKELKEFTFEQLLNNNPEISINGLTGSGQLSKLEYVKVRYRLTSSISQLTFIGLTSVKYLDLSGCQLEIIGKNAFDPFSNSLEVLNLNDNRLTSIADGLFDVLLPKDLLIIHIDRNRWHCDCDLLPFRSILQQFTSNFEGSILCSSPAICSISSILESNCFDECEPLTTLSPSTSSISTSMTTPLLTSTIDLPSISTTQAPSTMMTTILFVIISITRCLIIDYF